MGEKEEPLWISRKEGYGEEYEGDGCRRERKERTEKLGKRETTNNKRSTLKKGGRMKRRKKDKAREREQGERSSLMYYEKQEKEQGRRNIWKQEKEY